MKLEATKGKRIRTNGLIKASELLAFIQEHEKSDAYIETASEVSLCHIKDIKLNTDYVQEVRLFTEQAETKIVRRDTNTFIWRTIQDSSEGEPTVYIDETHKLWGTVAGSSKSKTILKEQRGTTITVPIASKKGEQVGLVFRKYIVFQDKDFAGDTPFTYGIEDERLVKFVTFKEAK